MGDRQQSDFTMQVGGVSEQTTVEASGEQLETATADLSQSIGAAATAQLPLLGRNPPSNNRSDKYGIHTFRFDHALNEKSKLFVDVLRSNRHEVKNNDANPTSSAGTFAFTQGFTQQNPAQPSSTSGDAFTSFLLSTPASGSVPVNASFAYQSIYYAAFMQDDWRVNSRLTLNLGGRWNKQVKASLFKNFNLTEALHLQVRAKAFNLTNTPWFNGPNTSITSAKSATRPTAQLLTAARNTRTAEAVRNALRPPLAMSIQGDPL